jgi:hypothetical protein
MERGGKMVIPRAEKLRVIQHVHSNWAEIYGDRDDVETNDAYMKMLEEALAKAEEEFGN